MSRACVTLTITLMLTRMSDGGSAAQERFRFPAMLMPFPAGPGQVISGYSNGDRHGDGGNLYSLDVCAGAGCVQASIGDPVVAPTDLTYVYSDDVNGADGDHEDYHIFQVALTGDQRLCMSLGHFDLTAPGALVDDERIFQGGEALGTLLDYRYDSASGEVSIPHIHMGIWSVPIGVGCAVSDGGKRTPIAFDGVFALDGQAFPIGGSQLGAVRSTNGSGAVDPGEPSPDRGGSGDVLPFRGQPVELWRTQTDADYAFSPELVEGALLASTYLPGRGTSALLVDVDSGAITDRLGNSGQSYVAAGSGPSGSVVVTESSLDGDGDAIVTSFDADTHVQRWQARLGVDKVAGALVSGDDVIIAGGTFRGDEGRAMAVALDASTGREEWRYTTDLDDLYQPVLDQGVLYFGSFNTGGGAAIIALDAGTGRESWRFTSESMWNVETPAIASRAGLAIAGAFAYDIDQGGEMLAVDLGTHALAWKSQAGLDVVYSPTIIGSDVYAGSFSSTGDAELIAADGMTGSELWRFKPEAGGVQVSSPTVVGDILYVGVGTWGADGAGALIAVSRDGSVLWTYRPDPGMDVVFAPTFGTGVAYLGTSDDDGAAIIAIGADE